MQMDLMQTTKMKVDERMGVSIFIKRWGMNPIGWRLYLLFKYRKWAYIFYEFLWNDMPDNRKIKTRYEKKLKKHNFDSLTILACVLPYYLHIVIHECKTWKGL
jgi:hypothetical protein